MKKNALSEGPLPVPVTIDEPSLLIRINRLYKPGMSDQALYDTTRGVWALGKRREMAEFAFAVFRGVVLEVYEIGQWHPAGTTLYENRVIDLSRYARRWEFTGELAPDAVRAKYVGRSVAGYFAHGAANPIMYVNC